MYQICSIPLFFVYQICSILYFYLCIKFAVSFIFWGSCFDIVYSIVFLRMLKPDLTVKCPKTVKFLLYFLYQLDAMTRQSPSLQLVPRHMGQGYISSESMARQVVLI